MSSSNEPATPPTAQSASLFGTTTRPGELKIDNDFVRDLCDQMNRLGALWALMGGIVEVIAIYFYSTNAATWGRQEGLRSAVTLLGITGIFWLVLGLMTCLKYVWAVPTGATLTAMSGLGLVGKFLMDAHIDLSRGISAGISFVSVILAWRIIRKLAQMREAGMDFHMALEKLDASDR